MAEGVRVAPRGAGVGAAEEKTLLLLCGPVADEQAGAGEVEGGPERGALVYGDTDGDRPGRGRPHCPWQPGNGGGGQLGLPRADLADGEGLPRATRTARRYEVGCGARPLRYGAVTSAGHGARLGRERPGRAAGRCGRWLRSRRRPGAGEEPGRAREVGSTGSEACGVRPRQVVWRALVGAAGRVRGRGSTGLVPVASRTAPERTAPSTGRWPRGVEEASAVVRERSAGVPVVGGGAALCRGRLSSVSVRPPPARRSGIRRAEARQLWGASLRMQVRRALHTRLPSSSVMTIS